MEIGRNDKQIDELDLYRVLREAQSRAHLLAPGAGRNEKLSSVVLQLRNMTESDFENCVVLIDAFASKAAKNQAKKSGKDKAKSESSKAFSEILQNSKQRAS